MRRSFARWPVGREWVEGPRNSVLGYEDRDLQINV